MEQLELYISPLPIAEPVCQSVEAWAKDKGTADHWLAAARYASHWGLGRVVSEVDYDAAIAAVQNILLK